MRTHALVLVTCLSLAAVRSGAQSALDCAPLLGQGQEEERPFLSQAPGAVTRPSRHRLAGRWAGGTRTFLDRAPYMEGDMDGARYLYCGYRRDVAMHLLYYQHDDMSEGVLLDNATGRTLPAGERVLFSPGREKYFASRQPNGL